MNTIYVIIIVGTIIGISVVFAVFQNSLEDKASSLSKQCDIPYDENFIKRREAYSGPNNGKPYYSIAEEFSIFYTIPIGEFRVDDISHSLILKPVPTSHGYIIMCDPLPVLEKRFDTKMNGIVVLVDGEEIEHQLVNDSLKITIKNHILVEIVGFSFV